MSNKESIQPDNKTGSVLRKNEMQVKYQTFCSVEQNRDRIKITATNNLVYVRNKNSSITSYQKREKELL